MSTLRDAAELRRIVRAMEQLPIDLASITAEYLVDQKYLDFISRAKDWRPIAGTMFGVSKKIGGPGDNIVILIKAPDGGGPIVFDTLIWNHHDRCGTDTIDDMWDFLVSGVPSPGMLTAIGRPIDSDLLIAITSLQSYARREYGWYYET